MFITDVDSISFVVDVGKSYDFIVNWMKRPVAPALTGPGHVVRHDRPYFTGMDLFHNPTGNIAGLEL